MRRHAFFEEEAGVSGSDSGDECEEDEEGDGELEGFIDDHTPSTVQTDRWAGVALWGGGAGGLIVRPASPVLYGRAGLSRCLAGGGGAPAWGVLRKTWGAT
jgi:hypothetical protein